METRKYGGKYIPLDALVGITRAAQLGLGMTSQSNAAKDILAGGERLADKLDEIKIESDRLSGQIITHPPVKSQRRTVRELHSRRARWRMVTRTRRN